MTSPTSDRIAICGEISFEDSLKQRLLFFDRIGILELDRSIDHWRTGRDRIPFFLDLANDLEFLQSRDLVFDAQSFLQKYHGEGNVLPILQEDDVAWKDAMASCILKLEYLERVARKRKKEKHLIEIYFLMNARRQFEARWCARCMRGIDGLEASALLSEPPRWDYLEEIITAPRPSTNVIDVVIDKLPMPSKLTPWEAILDFKADNEAQGYLQGLKVWMGEIARQKLTANEAREKLDWLLFQHKKHLRAHKLSCRWGTVGGTFVAAAETLEDFVKIKWGKAAGAVVSIIDRRLELTKAELANPAKEISYIVKAQEQFGEANEQTAPSKRF